MRMSDWSSDVCSSDLAISGRMPFRKTAHKRLIYKDNLKPQKTASTVLVIPASKLTSPRIQYFRLERFSAMTLRTRPLTWLSPAIFVVFCTACAVGPDYHAPADEGDRSEEHTSELQSLMRISYAVFCLKKQKNKQQSQNHINTRWNTYKTNNS